MIERVYEVFFNAGEVTEIRAYGVYGRNKQVWEGFAGGAGIVFGYFNNKEALAAAGEALEKAKAGGIYFVLNPVIPDLVARSSNRLKAADGKTPSTSDKDIQCIRWLPLDFDPVRPSGISSTDEELQAAIALRNKVAKWMEEKKGFPKGVRAISGNGAHLIYKRKDVELDRGNPSECPAVLRTKNCLRFLQEKFGTKQVTIDTSVFNSSRIWKLYGTTARKGDSIPTRPHRRSYLE